MNFFSRLGKGVEIVVRLGYAGVAIVFIAGAMYLLGGDAYLQGVWGTDTTSILAMLVWIDRYFPTVPFWYPLAGGGISLTHSYPVFSLYLVSFLERITSLNLLESFTMLGFSSVLIMALSIYAFVTFRFKNQTAAFLAAVFYLVSPIAWTWLVDWGFYAEAVAHMFVVPAILFWDFFFCRFLKNDWGIKTRIYLLITVLFITLGMASHFIAGFALIRLFFFYIIGYTLLSSGDRRQVFVRGTLALFLVGLFTYLSSAIFVIPYQRYAEVAAEAGLPSGELDFKALVQSLTSPAHVLGFKTYSKKEFLWGLRRFSFPVAVSLFAVGGLFTNGWRSKRVLAFGLFALFGFLVSLSPYYYWLQQYLPSFLPFRLLTTSGTGWREMFMVMRLIWPTLAALGVVSVASLPFIWIKNKHLQVLTGVVIAFVSVTVSGYALYKFGHLPQVEDKPLNYGAQGLDLRNIWQLPKKACFSDDEKHECFGYEKDDCLNKELVKARSQETGQDLDVWCSSSLAEYVAPLAVLDWCSQARIRLSEKAIPEICDVNNLNTAKTGKIASFVQKCRNGQVEYSLCKLLYDPLIDQLSPANWPEFKVRGDYNPDVTLNARVEEIAQENPAARIDFSPYLSDLSMLTPFYNKERNLSQLHVYVASASLVQRFQGWQQIVYYLNDPQYDDPNLINNIARWFGINYVFTIQNEYSTDEISIFERAGWGIASGSWEKGILRFPEKNSLVDLADRTAVLVVGQNKVSAYDQVLTVALLGVLPYEDAFLVWGRGAVDEYTEEDLEKFDIVLLHGYTYKDRGRADRLLSQYVQDGGSVFIDTGWQFTVPDWQTNKTLTVVPLTMLAWTDLGETSGYVLEDRNFSENVDVGSFAPLVYEEGSWGVSTADKNHQKEWANVVLSAKGKPLIITGQLGRGRVAWSGMNIFPHAKQKDKIYRHEIAFLRNLFAWLAGEKTSKSYQVSYTRDNPDQVEFSIQEDVTSSAYMLWKEGYYPDFKAHLFSSTGGPQRLSIKRAGPGWALIEVPKAARGDKIVYHYQKPLSEKAAQWISYVTLGFLLVSVFEGMRGEKSLVARILRRADRALEYLMFEYWKKPTAWLRKQDEEDEY